MKTLQDCTEPVFRIVMRWTASHRGSKGSGPKDCGNVRVECSRGSRLNRDFSHRLGLGILVDDYSLYFSVPFTTPAIVAPAEEYEVQLHGFVSTIVCTDVTKVVRSGISVARPEIRNLLLLCKVCHFSMFPCRFHHGYF